MNRFTRLASAVLFAMPVVSFAQDDDRKPSDDVRKTETRVKADGKVDVDVDVRANSIILTDVNDAGERTVRIETVPDKLRAELDTLRQKLKSVDSEKARAELNRALEEVERAKAMIQTDDQKIKAKVQAGAAKAQADIARVKADVDVRLRDANAKLRITKPARPAETEKAAFLGVGGSPLPQVLREQLTLPKGVGLVVEAVEPGSPAESAGVKRFDVLHKLNDQLIINTHQLAVLVRTHKPGQSLKLTLIRGGKEQSLDVKLAEKELAVLSYSADAFGWDLPELPHVPHPKFTPEIHNLKDFEVRLKDEWLRPDRQVRGQSVVLSRITTPDGKRLTLQTDADLSISLADNDGKKHLKVADKSGKSLFDGPFDTKEDRTKLPEELRGKIRVLEEGADVHADHFINLNVKEFNAKDFNQKFDVKFEKQFNNVRDEFRLDKRSILDRKGDRQEESVQAVEWSDDDQTLRVEVRDGKKSLIAKDKAGNELFAGPIDTESQRKALPPAVREKLDSGRWQSILKQLGE